MVINVLRFNTKTSAKANLDERAISATSYTALALTETHPISRRELVSFAKVASRDQCFIDAVPPLALFGSTSLCGWAQTEYEL